MITEIDSKRAIARYARRYIESLLQLEEGEPIPDWALDPRRSLYVSATGARLWELIYTLHALEKENPDGA